MNVGVILALCVFTIGACYSTYLGIGSFVSGQFPAPHAKVSVDCKVVRGIKATVCSLSKTLAGICMAIFTTMIALVSFVR
ncbi:hypothetical protein [Noviluteimonas gilva]|uniref:Uncharacterized protein n=1 Tax=Noviluteimonas gilva TaxID=2682097 RepID=A0A7C9I4S6_9GAMM|nr:hypothetical protein [Lysobacter gilvus]MUV13889.1 hypothetical protein [Lysobacter gilvus]